MKWIKIKRFFVQAVVNHFLTGTKFFALKRKLLCSIGYEIGENSKIGAGSVVLEEVPPNCTVVGVPGRIVRRENKKVPRSDMDQVHLPDPILEDIHELQQENESLKAKLQKMEYMLQDLEEKEKKNENL